MGKRKEKVEGELKVSSLNDWKNGTGLKKKKKEACEAGERYDGFGY